MISPELLKVLNAMEGAAAALDEAGVVIQTAFGKIRDMLNDQIVQIAELRDGRASDKNRVEKGHAILKAGSVPTKKI